MNDTTLRALRLLIKQADKLENSDLLKSILTQGMSATISWDRANQTIHTSRSHPTETERDAFVNSFRFFLHRADNVNFIGSKKVSDQLNDPALSTVWLNEFAKICGVVENFINRPPNGRFTTQTLAADGSLLSEETPTRWDILETFIYGEISHSTLAKVKRYEQWQKRPFFFLIEQEFISIMLKLLNEVAYLAALAKQELSVSDTTT